MAVTSLALTLALAASTPPAKVVVGDLGTRIFVLSKVRVESVEHNGRALRGWLCRRGVGPAIRRLSIVGQSLDGRATWSQTVEAPRFDPGRTHQCRVFKVELPREAGPEVSTWIIRRLP